MQQGIGRTAYPTASLGDPAQAGAHVRKSESHVLKRFGAGRAVPYVGEQGAHADAEAAHMTVRPPDAACDTTHEFDRGNSREEELHT